MRRERSPIHDGDIRDTEESAAVKKFRRSRAGCLTCRRRKVKCSEERPICENCDIGERQCLWPNPEDGQRRRRRRHNPSTQPVVEVNANVFRASPTCSRAAQDTESNIERNDDVSPWDDPLLLIKRGTGTVTTQPGFDFDGPLVDSGLRIQMMMDPSFLKPYFPTIDQRLVMRHYFSKTAHDLLAYQSPNQPFNPWITVHAPLAFNHLPGESPATDALRIAMLAVGTVHMRYASRPNDHEGVFAITRAAREKVSRLVSRAIERSGPSTGSPTQEDTEIILAALLSCTLASSLAADDAWHDLLTIVLNLIDRLGGVPRLFRDAPRDRLSPTRFVLEQLAVRDVFGCMTTGMAPSMLRSAFTPWFFEAESWSRTSLEWESIERAFGISRGMVDLIARACTLIAHVRETGYKVHEHDDEVVDEGPPTPPDVFSLRLPARVVARLNNTPLRNETSIVRSTGTISARMTDDGEVLHEQRNMYGISGDGIVMEEEDGQHALEQERERQRVELQEAANGLLAELHVWDQASNFTPLHPRTQYGNHCYRHAMRIWLLRNVFGVDHREPRVVAAVKAIIELGKELVAQYGSINWLTWPIMIAGFHMDRNDAARESVTGLLSNFGPHACFDNAAAARMMTEFWKMRDQDESIVLDHWEVSDRLQRRPFLD